MFLVIPSGGLARYFALVPVAFNSSLENRYTFAPQMRLYADPGQTVQIGTGRIGALLADYSCTLQAGIWLPGVEGPVSRQDRRGQSPVGTARGSVSICTRLAFGPLAGCPRSTFLPLA